jgi:mannose-1-phosphate guanylyltransferase
MKFYENDQNRCAIILAGGDGRRLSEVTRRITGDATPKQFCPVIGSTPLVGQTCLSRFARNR